MRINKCHTLLLFMMAVIGQLSAQVTVSWGSIDKRYPVEVTAEIKPIKNPSMTAWKGERVNMQLVVANCADEQEVAFEFGDLVDKKGNKISAEYIKGGIVEPVIADSFSGCGKHAIDAHGTFPTADRITMTSPVKMSKNAMRGLWMTLQVPRDVVAGTYCGKVTVTAGGKSNIREYKVKVLESVLPEPKDWKFHLDLWQNPYAIARVHNVELWSPEHFAVLRPYMEKLAAAGQKAITATLINRPWNGQTHDPFGSMVTWIKRADGTWLYDFTIFDRWVEFMHDCGISKEITCFSMIPWKLSFRYYDQATDSHKEIKCAPGQKEYTEFWGNMLKAFNAHLAEKGWLGKTFISMDERALKQMQAAIKVIRDYAHGIKVSLAGYYHPEIEKDLSDYCVDYNGHKTFPKGVVERRRSEGKVSTYYTCCSAKYPNLFTFTDPADCEYVALHCLQIDVDGYLRWAYNSWTAEPEKDARFRQWSAGDTHVIYPGNTSSIRWERLVQGIQSFEKWHIMMADAKARNDKGMQRSLEKVKNTLDIHKIADYSEEMTENFRTQLNKLSANKKY